MTAVPEESDCVAKSRQVQTRACDGFGLCVVCGRFLRDKMAGINRSDPQLLKKLQLRATRVPQEMELLQEQSSWLRRMELLIEPVGRFLLFESFEKQKKWFDINDVPYYLTRFTIAWRDEATLR
jgi:hypothetical protein